MKTNNLIIWSRNNEDNWKRWDSPVFFLDAVSEAAAGVKSVFIMDDPVDEGRLVAVIRTAGRLARGSIEIAVGFVHPSLSRLESVRQAGAEVMPAVVNCKSFGRSEIPPVDGVAALGDRLCPQLHIKHEQGISLSVCGRHNDRMVLAHHHLEKWCLEKKNECPHWSENA